MDKETMGWLNIFREQDCCKTAILSDEAVIT